MGGGGGGGGHLAGATQVSVMELPQQLLILHRQTFVDLGLLVKGFLQHSLLCRQLSVMQQHNRHVRNTPTCSISDQITSYLIYLYIVYI